MVRSWLDSMIFKAFSNLTDSMILWSRACKDVHKWRWPTVSCAEMHHPPPHCAHIHVWSPSTFRKCQQMSVGAIFFHTDKFDPHLCFIHTSMSVTILLGCPSAAISHTATKRNSQESSASTAIPTSTFDFVVQHNNRGGITFKAAILFIWKMSKSHSRHSA